LIIINGLIIGFEGSFGRTFGQDVPKAIQKKRINQKTEDS